MALRVTPEELMALANKIADLAEQLNNEVKVLDGKIESVSEAWTGISSNAFYNNYVEMQPALHSYAEVVQGIASVAQTAAKAYDSTDEEIAKNF